jgi:hypothetical protein
VVLLIGFATISRFLASMMPLYREILLGTAGVMWSANFIVVAYFSFFRNKGGTKSRIRQGQRGTMADAPAGAVLSE